MSHLTGHFIFFSDGKLTWIYRGSVLIVNSFNENGDPYLLAEANFARLLEDETVSISYVCQLRDHLSDTDPEWNPFALVVVINRRSELSHSSFVCIYDSRLSRILKAIECPFVVRLAEPIIVSHGGRAKPLIDRLPQELKVYHGLIALGCGAGTVTLVDLCLDTECETALPTRKLTFASRSRNYDPHAKRQSANVNLQHISLPLNSECQNKFQFTYKVDEAKKVPLQLNKTYVTCLKYIPRTNVICVAYNFGGYHLYDLEQLNLLYSGSLDDDNASVIGFAFQEPEEDPKNLCYLWVLRGSTVKDCGEYGVASIQLTSLTFGKKTWIEGFGHLYSEFENSVPIFDYDLTGFPYVADRENCTFSMIINYGTLLLGSPWYLRGTNEDYTPDTTLFYISWEATNDTSDNPIQYFAIFDINQFYKAQMPKSIEVSGELHLCPFLGFFSMAEIVSDMSNETILDFIIDVSTIEKFQTANFIHELHFHPSSLSFVASTLTDQSFMKSHYFGLQKLTLNRITSSGASVVLKPTSHLTNAVKVALCSPRDIHNENLHTQRELLLTLLLERNELSFLYQIIKSTVTGELSSREFTMKTIIDWIWSRVSIVKGVIDEVSLPYFDSSKGGVPDENYLMKTLYANESDLKNFSALLKYCLTLLDPSGGKFHQECIQLARERMNKIELITWYLRMMLWLRWCGLLPEITEGSTDDPEKAIYPRRALTASYKEKRKKLSALKAGSKTTDFLIIDRLLYFTKDSISEHWKKVGNSSVYPPPSIHSLLSMYLLENASLEVKHLIASYFFLDLVTHLPENTLTNNIKSFASAFALPQHFTKYVSGLWCVDNGNFRYAIPNLLDPSVVKEFFTPNSLRHRETDALHREICQKIIEALVLQNEEIVAQRFMLVCKIHTTPSSNLDHQKLKISTLLSNGQILPAFELVRSAVKSARVAKNNFHAEDMINHFFSICESRNLMKFLVKLPFDNFEERKFESYLMKHSKLPQAKLILIVFLLQCNKFNHALHVYDIVKMQKDSSHNVPMNELWIQIERMIDAYKSALPNTILSQTSSSAHLAFTGDVVDEENFSDIASSEFDDAESVTSSMSQDIATSTPRKTRRTRRTIAMASDSTDSVVRTHKMKLRSSARKKSFK